MGRSLFEKVWDEHVIRDLGGGYQLLHIDRHFLHDLSGPGSLRAIGRRGLKVRDPGLTFATPDHCVATTPGRTDDSSDSGSRLIPVLRTRCEEENITYFDINSDRQGIVHVIGPQLGLTLPGATIVCGDSHTCTHGAFGALAYGIGSSELNHVLATQCVIERKPKILRVTFSGQPGPGVTAKDMILYLIGQHGADLGSGYAAEFAGEAISALSMEQRMTLCNLSIEMGSRVGMIAPDERTFEFLEDREYSPKGRLWDLALEHWKTLVSDGDAVFHREIQIDTARITPQITWGTSPEHTIGVGELIPDAMSAPNESTAESWRQAYAYMDVAPGQVIAGLPIQRVFIGSCANSRLSDLEAAAAVARQGKVAAGVTAWVVPGSQQVKRDAEALGLDRIFLDAGFEWREPGCSQCVATNGEFVAPGDRCVSTSNRNFVGRQGPGARTHLASPAMAAWAALNGCIGDVREAR